jgi:Tfp pilus assembly protein PilV
MIEALVAAMLFVLGILGLVGAMSQTVSNQTDVEIRNQASTLAQDMMNTVWLNLDRTTAATAAASLQAFSHQPTGTDCGFSGDASANARVSSWVTNITTGSGLSGLPGATTAMQQILVDTTNNNQVKITLCWQASRDVAPRKYELVSFVN